MQERKALGKGLSSLIPMGNRSSSNERNNKFFDCDIDDVIPSPNQPRKLFDKNAIDELAASIDEKGILQPLIVREIGGGKYEIVAGERRYRAARSLNIKQVPVIVKDIDDQEMLELALIENLQREDLNPIEEALAFKELLERYQYTQDELAKRIGKDRSSIANTLRLLKLPEGIRSSIIAGQISMGHARALLAIEQPDLQKKIAEKIIENQLSVREIEDWVRRLKNQTIETENKIDTIDSVVAPTSEIFPVNHLEEELKKALKTKVAIRNSGTKGKIIINYHSKEELDRLFDLLMSL